MSKKNPFLIDPDYRYISEAMMTCEGPGRPFSFKDEDNSLYPQSRLEKLIEMLNSTGYKAKMIFLPNRLKGIYVEPTESQGVSEIFESEVTSPEEIIHENHMIEFSDSSAIKSIGWDEGTLTVVFTSGSKTYTFGEVPKEVYNNFLDAPSKGRFFQKEIKDKYPDGRKSLCDMEEAIAIGR